MTLICFIHCIPQEQRFKSYHNHLELCLREIGDIVGAIRDPVRSLFKSHINNVMQALQPGLTTLAWNSMNIDAFLHQIHTGWIHCFILYFSSFKL